MTDLHRIMQNLRLFGRRELLMSQSKCLFCLALDHTPVSYTSPAFHVKRNKTINIDVSNQHSMLFNAKYLQQKRKKN